MVVVYIKKSLPTAAEFEEDMKLYFPKFWRWEIPAERDRSACADCPFYELFPSERLGQGSTWGWMFGGDTCHHPDWREDRENYSVNMPCEGKRCNCDLPVQSWLDAWEKEYIVEED